MARGITVEFDKLVKLYGLPDSDDIMEMNVDYIGETYAQVHKAALREALDDEMDDDAAEAYAEEKAQKAEQETSDEVYRTYVGAVESAVETTMGHANIDVELKKDGKWHITPQKSWEDSAKKIVEILNGVGMFHFSSLREFLDSGPYTAREAVEKHLGVTADYAEVYGDSSPKRLYERAWR